MFNDSHFYHGHIRRIVAVFGTLFNNISVVKFDSDGHAVSTIKVPLAYGPRQKFLARLSGQQNLQDPKLAIRLPRMSFEITSLSYDTTTRHQKGLTRPIFTSDGKKQVLYPTTYRLGMQLAILSKNSDDGLQILEQILPYFQPTYTVTIREIDNNFKTDLPFTLTSVSTSDDYESDFLTRRSIIHTLDFETEVRFYGPVPETTRKEIKWTKTTVSDTTMPKEGNPFFVQNIRVSPLSATESEPHEIHITYNPITPAKVRLYYDTISNGPFSVDDSVVGSVSGATGRVIEVNANDNYIVVDAPDENFVSEEVVSKTGTATSFTLTKIDSIWNSLIA